MVGPVKNDEEESSLSSPPPPLPTDNNIQQQHYRLQLLAQAIEKVESECSQKQLSTTTSVLKKQHAHFPIDSLSMTSSAQHHQQQQQHQDLLIQLLAQQNVAAVMAAAAAAQLQGQQKLEPISPPSTSSASSTAESPIDFSSHHSIDDMNECSTPSSSLSPVPNHQQLISTMLQNFQTSTPTTNFPLLLTNKNGKPTRPFKAYPREPLMLPIGFCSNPTLEQANILLDAATRSTQNRKRLAQTQERLKQRLQQQQQQQQQQLISSTHFISSSGTQILQPPKKRHRMMENSIINEDKPSPKGNNTEETNLNNNSVKDDAYWERRRKNNEAAKRSRDARRVKEDEIALRAAILEQENMKLRLELTQLKQETAKLRCMVHASS